VETAKRSCQGSEASALVDAHRTAKTAYKKLTKKAEDIVTAHALHSFSPESLRAAQEGAQFAICCTAPEILPTLGSAVSSALNLYFGYLQDLHERELRRIAEAILSGALLQREFRP
jgi:hypothetical protein